MSTSMKAAFTLTLDDKLSAGLANIKKAFDELRGKGEQLTLGKLERGGDLLRTLTQEVRGLTSSLSAVSATADRAWASIKRMGSATANWGRKTFGASSNIGAIGAAAAGFSVWEPLHAYANYENILRHSAITKGLSGVAAEAEIKRLDAVFRHDALATGQSSTNIAQAYQDLIQTGMSSAMAEKLLPIHSRAATAYNISPEALGHAVFALSDSFKIDEHEMAGALASMALASKEGRFKVEDFSRFLPSIGGDMAKLGMTGRASADRAFAALETVMKYSADPGSGAANFSQFLNDLTSPGAARTFALKNRGMSQGTRAMLDKYHVQGIELPALLEDASKRGIDPITAVMAALNKSLHGLPQIVKAEVLGAFFPNKEARITAQSLMDHQPENKEMQARLSKANTGLLDRDFATAFRAPLVQMRLMSEMTDELNRRFGEGFEPVLHLVNRGLLGLVHAMDWLDKKLPGLANGVLAFGGGLLMVLAAIGAIGFVAPAVIAGFELIAGLVGLLVTPVGLLAMGIAALAVAGYEVYDNWDDVVPVLKEFGDAVSSVFYSAMDTIHDWMMNGLRAAGDAWDDMVARITSNDTVAGAIRFLSDAWDGVKTAAQTAFDVMDRFEGGRLSQVLGGIRDIVNEIADAFKAIGMGSDDASAWTNALSGPAPGTTDEWGAPATPHQLEVTVHAAPGTHATVTHASPGVSVRPNPGPTTNRH